MCVLTFMSSNVAQKELYAIFWIIFYICMGFVMCTNPTSDTKNNIRLLKIISSYENCQWVFICMFYNRTCMNGHSSPSQVSNQLDQIFP